MSTVRIASRCALAVAAALLGSACVEERIEPMTRNDARADTAPVQDGSDTDAMSEPDVADASAPAVDAGPLPDGAVACRPNNDGVIERAEMPYLLGAQSLYVANDDGTTVDAIQTAPTMGASGPQWDFSAMRPSDRRVFDEVVAPSGKWWQPLYPSANFALPIDRASSVFALYRASGDALSILATVSRNAGTTNVAFTPAVDALRFPLREGSSWTVTSVGAGLFNGIATNITNVYRFTVDGRGTVLTPATRFPALRLRMELSQTGLTIPRTQRTYLFLSECWGLVARVASVDNETAMEFTRASEYRRLGL
jgi:hypothetical protein